MAKRIDFAESAKAEIRAIDRATAMDILIALGRYATAGVGDVKRLQGIEPPEWRLRVGSYRVRFHEQKEFIFVRTVKHRREAYR